jgi:hypothetical protein
MKLFSCCALVCACLWLAGCESGVTGPSLAASLSNVNLRPTVENQPLAENVCCCYITGSVTNNSSVTVHAELLFDAKNASGTRLGTGISIIPSLLPGATESFTAVGITEPCRNLNLGQIIDDKVIKLKGIWEPT